MHTQMYKYAFLNVDDCTTLIYKSKQVITKVMYMYMYKLLFYFVLLGTVDLHNLPLKKTALKGLELPLEVKSGFIGHLQLSIPLRRPKSEPWIVHITKLYLVAGPLQHSEVIKLCDKCSICFCCQCLFATFLQWQLE